MAGERTNILKSVQAKVLIKCRRRCCLCWFWNDDLGQKRGQLAHVDRDPLNNHESNIAYLCLPHHDEYDSTFRQTKRAMPEELIAARDALYTELGDTQKREVTVNLELADKGTAANPAAFVNSLRELLNGADVVLDNAQHLEITVRVRAETVQDIIELVESNAVSAQLTSVDPYPSIHRSIPLAGLYGIQDGFVPEVVNPRLAHDVIGTPERQQHIARGKDVLFDDATFSLFVVDSKSQDRYSTLVVTDHQGGFKLDAAFRVFQRDVPHSLDWPPLKILESFAETYALPIRLERPNRRLLINHVIQPPSWVTTRLQLDIYIKDQVQSATALSDDVGWLDVLAVNSVFNVTRSVFIEMAMVIDRRKYALALRDHGMKLHRRHFQRSSDG